MHYPYDGSYSPGDDWLTENEKTETLARCMIAVLRIAQKETEAHKEATDFDKLEEFVKIFITRFSNSYPGIDYIEDVLSLGTQTGYITRHSVFNGFFDYVAIAMMPETKKEDTFPYYAFHNKGYDPKKAYYYRSEWIYKTTQKILKKYLLDPKEYIIQKLAERFPEHYRS